MSDLLDRIWAAVEPSLYTTKEQWLAGLTGWFVQPHTVHGVTVGAVMTRGPEIHFITLDRFDITRADIKRYLIPIIEKHGVVITKTPVDDTRMQRFNKILGFEATGEDEFFVHFALKRLPFSRST